LIGAVLVTLYLGVGACVLAGLSGFAGAAVIAALKQDIHTLRHRSPIALIAIALVWVTAALVAWPIIATCETITRRAARGC
jgi:hypothetical protein